jgi:hypothetical protein
VADGRAQRKRRSEKTRKGGKGYKTLTSVNSFLFPRSPLMHLVCLSDLAGLSVSVRSHTDTAAAAAAAVSERARVSGKANESEHNYF